MDPVPWSGSFTEAYANNPTPALSTGTTVGFVVSNTLSSAVLRIYDGSGAVVKTCSSGTACAAGSNPAPGTSETYHAEVWVQLAGACVHYATSPTVTVTDPGWTGSFTQAYANNPTPALSTGTMVNFVVSNTLSSASMRVFDGTGAQVKTCASGTACAASSNPAPGTSQSFHAEVWVMSAGSYVHYATSASVTVTDPGWTGSFDPLTDPYIQLSPGQARSIAFTWDEPLGGERLRIRSSDGVTVGTCTSASATVCAASVAVASGEIKSYWAEVYMPLLAGGELLSGRSGAVVVTTLSEPELLDVLLSGTDSQLAALLGPDATATAVAALRAGATALATDEAACLLIGAADPTHPEGSSASTTQLACATTSQLASLTLATAVGIGGLVATLVNYGGTHPTEQQAPEPPPQPQPDPQPEPSVGPSPQPEPENALFVYRVWGGVSGPYGTSWTTLNPLWHEFANGAGSYRRDAGLPDFNTGTYLTTAKVLDPLVVAAPFPAFSYENPAIHYYVPGGLPEVTIVGGCSNPAIECVGTVALVPPWGILPMHLTGE